MADPKENEEINEELSTEELKSVSGGFSGHVTLIGAKGKDRIPIDPKGSGSGMSRKDWDKLNLSCDPMSNPETGIVHDETIGQLEG